MRKTIIVLCVICFLSCKNSEENRKDDNSIAVIKQNPTVKDLNYHLGNGLVDLDSNFGIEQKFNKEVYLRSFGFYEKGVNQYDIILELQDDITEDIVSKYTFAVEGFAEEADLNNLSDYAKKKKRKHEAWFGTPKLTRVNNHCYVVFEANTKLINFELIKFFLYDKEGYKGDIGERILFYNYEIK